MDSHEGASIVIWTVSGLLPPMLVTLRTLQWGEGEVESRSLTQGVEPRPRDWRPAAEGRVGVAAGGSLPSGKTVDLSLPDL